MTFVRATVLFLAQADGPEFAGNGLRAARDRDSARG